MSCSYVTLINGTQCIGDSLRTINANFSALEAGLCEEAARSFTASVDISAGDGLLVEKNQEEENFSFALNLQNSIQYISPTLIEVTNKNLPDSGPGGFYKTTMIDVYSSNNATVKVINVPRQSLINYGAASFSFETVALGNTSPSLTIYWLSSAQSSNVVYATNPNAIDSFNINNTVRSITPYTVGSDSDYIFIAGDFTTAAFKPKATTKYNYRIAPLKLAAGTSTVSGTPGTLSAFTDPTYGTSGQAVLNIINTNQDSPGKFIGFNSSINKTVIANINNNRLLCVGGSFTGGGYTSLDARTRGLVILNLTSPNVAPFCFTLNGNVYDLLVVDQYLYVCGNFTTANAINTPSAEALSVFRIDLTNIVANTSPTTWIDKAFSDRFNDGYKHPTKPSSRTIDTKSSFVRCLAVDPEKTHLYVGGTHVTLSASNQRLITTNRGITVHNIEDANPGLLVSNWKYQINGGSVVTLATNTIYDNVTNNILETVLYAGGDFKTVVVGTPITKQEIAANTYTRQSLACFQLIDYDNSTGAILNDHPSNPTLKTDWYINASGAIHCFGLEDQKSDSPLYIGGTFKSINGAKVANIAAISKPNQIGGRANLFNWNMAINGPVYTMQTILSSSPLNDGVAIEKVSLLIGGGFTKILGIPKSYLARVSCYNQVPTVIPLSSVVWEVAGQTLEAGGSMDIVADTTMVQNVTANPIDCLNVTKFPPFTQGFESVTRGDLCRFVVTRPLSTDSFTDTYARSVHVVGVSLDFNTQYVNPTDFPDVTINS
jgi:hypothetical protein